MNAIPALIHRLRHDVFFAISLSMKKFAAHSQLQCQSPTQQQYQGIQELTHIFSKQRNVRQRTS